MLYLLDTTLRDGGYVINWEFGKNKTQNIIKKLYNSNIDFIELGFLKDNKQKNQTTIFKSIDEAKNFIKNYDTKKFSLMIKSGEFNIDNLPKAEKNDIFIRYIFKKKSYVLALKECEKIILKGYRLAINPVFIDEYNDREYIDLINCCQKLNPYILTVVDSIGIMDKIRLKEIFSYLDKTNNDTKLGFHCHNNTEGALVNCFELFKINLKKDIIIDCTVSGMGRGAGNLCSEIICQYLNYNFSKKYDIEQLENIIDCDINCFYEKNPWGNSYPYYICALYKCHPDYAGYLIKKGVDYKKTEELLKLIPDNKKDTFDFDLFNDIIVKKSENVEL